MKLHRVELEHVRGFRRLALELPPGLTVIGGPQGVGKSTLQKAILAALFQLEKRERENLRSRFDPDSPPTAKLVLSRALSSEPISLFRRLIDDTGEWQEGAITLKQKGKALAKVQEALPIPGEAAAVLLWGLQEDMAAVVEKFPAEGHTLLTCATIRGAGPDPKAVIVELEKEMGSAKKKGKNPGRLTDAESRIESLNKQLTEAEKADGQLKTLQHQYDTAKKTAGEARKKCEKASQEIDQMAELEELLDKAVKAAAKVTELETRRQQWEELEGEIDKAERLFSELRSEKDTLEKQYRIGRNQELNAKSINLQEQINEIEGWRRKQREAEEELESLPRPDKDDLERLEKWNSEIKEATARMEATGVRYEFFVQAGEQEVRVTADAARPKTILLQAGAEPEFGVVGRIEIVADSLVLVASGKQSISSFKGIIERTNAEIERLFQSFGVKDEAGFRSLHKQRTLLEKKIDEAKGELKGSKLASLKAELKLAEQEVDNLRVTQEERDALAGRVLRASAEINTDLAGKRGEIKIAEDALKALKAKRPASGQEQALQARLGTSREDSELKAEAFKKADALRRNPEQALLEEIQRDLKTKREGLPQLLTDDTKAITEVTRLSTELKHAGPERPVAAIRSELEDAQAILRREEIFQEARGSLKQRIEEKITEMTESVPRELGTKVSEYLHRLSKGAYGKVHLTEVLGVSTVLDNGETPESWQPHELSHGERHQAALAVKIAVARALAEMGGPVFIILDDSLVHFDPARRAATEGLLTDLVADGKLQVILLTCHTDWAADWRKRNPDLKYIELAEVAEYYRTPVALLTSTR